ncbi:MAG: DEAD/DEAH box helicase [Phycisphaerales bacterium]
MATLGQLVPSITRTLIVAPWSQLTEQLAREIDGRFWTKAGVPPARIRKAAACFTPATLASHLDAADAPEILICTNQTLERLHSSDNQGHQRLAARTSLVMVDEGHREPAPRWAAAVRALAKPTAFFSATPYRNDHRPFHIDPKHIYRFPHDEAVSQRFIRDVRF